ncbi:uncharacterized protein LOC126751024 isoform X1 [Bactrocera neohumeralis]|nr:uncharacterized protein LOC126751024 isoform X1 [Bactrocera neohumeralis]
MKANTAAVGASAEMPQSGMQQRRHQHQHQHHLPQPLKLILALVIIICLQGTNCFQRFSEQPKYSEVNPGQDALLTCKVIDKRGTCSWQKDNKPVGIYAKKYEWAARPSSSSGGNLHLDLHPPPMQIGGDCSLWIRSATLDFDDGLWECQVTASDFTTQDALTSQPVRLVVRVVPQRPRLEYEGAHVPPGHNITIDSGALATVKCVSHYGNPPATLKWYLGDQEIQPIHPQINNTEPDNPRTWSATSVVQVTAMRERHGDILRCLAYHESYTAKSVPVEARLDVKYAPTIRLIGSPEIDLEEDKDALILRCVADANPPASIVWRRAGRSEIASLQETLQLRPVGRRDAGLYTCQAQNSVGTSEQLSVQLDVKYPPKIVSAGPDRLTTAPLFSPAAFECVAEGNPMPSYKWVQRIAHGSKFVERGSEPRLVIDNVTYDYQGEYECRATNYINGQERVAVSEPISLQVVGAPQVLRPHPSMHTISVKRGQPAVMSLVVCADPRPHRVSWEWGSLRLEAGSGIDRFRADDMLQDSREDCYLSTLHILRTDEHDSRPYYLVVENERGTDRHAIHLNVEGTFTEPLEMSYLLGIAGGCLAAILILICLCIYAVRSKKCCFKGSSGYKSSDKDSEKADLKSRSDSTSGPQGDSIYTTPAGFHHHQQQQQQQQLQQHHQQAQQQQQQQQHHHLQTAHGSPEAMKPVSHKTTTTTKATFDGELLWQQEATEFIERFPQRRRQHDALRPSVSAGALYKNATGITTLNKRASGGELLTAQQRHQRDLFSGDLGIPEVRSHVGSMVHTFETLAMQRKLADQERAKERAWALQQQQQWEREQLAERSCKYTPTLKSAIHTTTYTYDTPTHTSRHSQHGTSNSKYHQLKRKSHESRQRLIKLSKQQLLAAFNNSAKRAPSKTAHTKLESSLSAQSLPGADNNNVLSPSSSPLKRHSTLSLHCAEVARAAKANDDHLIQQYCHLDDDYRKNLFGTISSRLTAVNKGCEDINSYDYSGARHNSKRVSHEEEEDMDVGAHINVEHDEALIVSAAFDEIFASYSGIDDDEEDEKKFSAPAMLSRATTYSTGFEEQMVSLSELDDDVFKSLSSSRINNIGCPGNTPMKLPPLATSTHKKPATPATNAWPTNGAVADAAQTPKRKRTIMPLAKQKQRATTLHNLFDRLKATQTKVKRPFVKMPSDSLLKQDQLSIEQMTHALHKYSPQLNLYREIGEGEAAGERSDADGDFLRGSTLSQSFVRQQPNTRENKDEPKRKKSAPPPPPINHTKSNSGISGVNAVNGAPRPSFASQRAKSTNELLLDDLAVQARRYQRAASRKYAAPPTPRKQQQPVEEGSEVTQRSKPNRAISRGNGVGADIFLRGSAEI